MEATKYNFLSEVVSMGHPLAEAHRLHDLATQAAVATGAPIEEALWKTVQLARAAINSQLPAEKITKAMIELPFCLLDLQILEGARILSEAIAARLAQSIADTQNPQNRAHSDLIDTEGEARLDRFLAETAPPAKARKLTRRS